MAAAAAAANSGNGCLSGSRGIVLDDAKVEQDGRGVDENANLLLLFFVILNTHTHTRIRERKQDRVSEPSSRCKNAQTAVAMFAGRHEREKHNK